MSTPEQRPALPDASDVSDVPANATPPGAGASLAQDALAPQFRVMERRLDDDAERWAADLAETAQRLGEWAQDVPQRAPLRAPASHELATQLQSPIWPAQPAQPARLTSDVTSRPSYPTSMRGYAPMSSTAVRVSAALAAVVVIALFGSLFYIHGIHTDTFKSGPASTITTGATPGSAAYYVPSAVTARGIDKHYSPVGTTAHFRVGDTVYVVVRVANVAQGTSNTLAIAWYLDGHLLSPVGRLEQRIPPQTTSPFNAYFSLPFNQSGVGMAKIYWNAPASDPGTSASDPALAQTLTFTVAN